MFRVSAWLDVCAFRVSGSNPACYFASSNFAQVVCGLIDAAMESALSTPRGAAKHASREAEASGAAEHAGATKTKVTHLTDIVRVFEPVQGEPDADSIREAAVVLLSGKQGDLRRLCSKPSRSTAPSRNWGVSLRDRLSGAIRKDADIRKELEKKVLAAARKYLSSVGAAEQASTCTMENLTEFKLSPSKPGTPHYALVLISNKMPPPTDNSPAGLPTFIADRVVALNTEAVDAYKAVLRYLCRVSGDLKFEGTPKRPVSWAETTPYTQRKVRKLSGFPTDDGLDDKA